MLANQEFTVSSDWQQFSCSFNTGSNTSLVFVFTDSSNIQGTLYVDDCFLGVSGGSNKLSNPGFESGDTSWTSNDSNIFSIVEESASQEPDEDGNTHSGTWAMKAQVSGSPTWNTFYQNVSGVPTQTQYVASVWMKGTGKLRLRVYSANWSTMIADQEFTAVSEWQQFSYSFNTGNNTGLVFVLTDSSNIQGTLYVDDCFLGVSGGSNKLSNPGFENGNTSWTIFDPNIFSIIQPGSSSSPNIDGFLCMVYEGNSLTNIAAYENWIGRSDFYVYSATGFANWNDYDSSLTWLIDTMWGPAGKKVFWNVPLFTATEGNYAGAANGWYNDYYRSQAERIEAFCSDYDVIYIRTSWEFNGYWFPWTILAGPGENQQQKTQDFINAYRQFVDTFRSVSDKFRFEWNVNIGESFPLETAYPGDEYVDIIGMDVYADNYANISDLVRRFQYTMTRPYGLIWLRDFARAHNKPIAISEWGVGGKGSGDDPHFVESMFRWFNANDTVYQLYWDSNDDYAGQLRPTTSYPNASAKYKELFGNYSGPSTTNTPGNVLAAVTEPGGVRPNNDPWYLSNSPSRIKGIALDPDGNNYISEVTVTIQNSSGQYLNVSTKTFVSYPVYNQAVYNSSDGYWTLDLSGITLGSGTYTVRGYANDGASNIPAMCEFIR